MTNKLKKIFLAKHENFTAKEKEIASYFINNTKDIPRLNSSDIAKICNVTSSIVVRTSKKLGFSGFLDLKNSIKSGNELKKGKIQNTLELIKDKDDFFSSYIEGENEVLKNLLTNNSAKSLRKIAKILNEKNTVYICGYDISKIIGDYFAFRLSGIGKKVICITGSKRTLSNSLISMGKNDILIAIGFPPVNKETLISLEYAKKHNIESIVITDSLSCEFCKFSSNIIQTPRGNENTLNSVNAPLTVIHYLILELIKLNENIEVLVKDIKEIIDSY